MGEKEVGTRREGVRTSLGEKGELGDMGVRGRGH